MSFQRQYFLATKFPVQRASLWINMGCLCSRIKVIDPVLVHCHPPLFLDLLPPVQGWEPLISSCNLWVYPGQSPARKPPKNHCRGAAAGHSPPVPRVLCASSYTDFYAAPLNLPSESFYGKLCNWAFNEFFPQWQSFAWLISWKTKTSQIMSSNHKPRTPLMQHGGCSYGRPGGWAEGLDLARAAAEQAEHIRAGCEWWWDGCWGLAAPQHRGCSARCQKPELTVLMHRASWTRSLLDLLISISCVLEVLCFFF